MGMDQFNAGDQFPVEVVVCITQNFVKLLYFSAPKRIFDVEKNPESVLVVYQMRQQEVPHFVIKIVVGLTKRVVIEERLIRDHDGSKMQQRFVEKQVNQSDVEIDQSGRDFRPFYFEARRQAELGADCLDFPTEFRTV